MSRADRRAEERIQRKKNEATKKLANVLQGMYGNGLTVEILEKEWKRGYDAGFSEGFNHTAERILKMTYAGICLALDNTYHFKADRCMKVLNELDRIITYELTSDEIVDEIYRRLGLQLCFDATFEDKVKKSEVK